MVFLSKCSQRSSANLDEISFDASMKIFAARRRYVEGIYKERVELQAQKLTRLCRGFIGETLKAYSTSVKRAGFADVWSARYQNICASVEPRIPPSIATFENSQIAHTVRFMKIARRTRTLCREIELQKILVDISLATALVSTSSYIHSSYS